MKKFFIYLTVLIGLFLIPDLIFARNTKVIPYPNNSDINTEGAAAAPKEINHKKSKYFKTPNIFEMTSNKELRVLTHYPTYQQTTEYSCGPAAALTVLWYYNYKNYTENNLVKTMGTSSQTGTTVKGMADFFRNLGWKVKVNDKEKTFNTYENFADFIIQQLELKHPILVVNVTWGGHWRVIIGYDTIGTDSNLDDVLIFADPYDTADHNQDGYTIENGQKFFWTWFDNNVLPKDERNQPFVLAYPEENTKN